MKEKKDGSCKTAVAKKPEEKEKFAQKVEKFFTEGKLRWLALALVVMFIVVVIETSLLEKEQAGQEPGPSEVSKEPKEPVSVVQQEEKTGGEELVSWEKQALFVGISIPIIILLCWLLYLFTRKKAGTERTNLLFLINKVGWITFGFILSRYNGLIPYDLFRIPWYVIPGGIILIVIIQLIGRYRHMRFVRPIFETGKWTWEHWVFRTIIFLVPCVLFF